MKFSFIHALLSIPAATVAVAAIIPVSAPVHEF
jgi:hypothetical protein